MALDTSIPVRIVELVQAEGLKLGTHLPAQMLADKLDVSRSPVNEALSLLHRAGLLSHEPHRGYFLLRTVDDAAAFTRDELKLGDVDDVTRAYRRIADDRLQGLLPDSVSEGLLRRRYGLTPARLDAVLSRITGEGWASRRPGYGWTFSPMLTTPDSLLQSYRMRLAIEPAALCEPGYRLDPHVLARCRAAEEHLLGGGIETDSAEQLHERGVRFHESLVQGSGNAFFIDAIQRVNRVRRLLSYRSTQDRARYREHCEQHLQVLALLERGRNAEAAEAMRTHLQSTLRNLEMIRSLLGPGGEPSDAWT